MAMFEADTAMPPGRIAQGATAALLNGLGAAGGGEQRASGHPPPPFFGNQKTVYETPPVEGVLSRKAIDGDVRSRTPQWPRKRIRYEVRPSSDLSSTLGHRTVHNTTILCIVLKGTASNINHFGPRCYSRPTIVNLTVPGRDLRLVCSWTLTGSKQCSPRGGRFYKRKKSICPLPQKCCGINFGG
jgi:hypothetical protein